MTPWMDPIEDASVWTGEDLERDPSWKFSLTPQQVTDLDSALQQVKNRGLNFAEILRDDFPLPSLTGPSRAFWTSFAKAGVSRSSAVFPRHTRSTIWTGCTGGCAPTWERE
jgi:hypothetical protein